MQVMQAMLKADDIFRFVVALEGSWDGALDQGDLPPTFPDFKPPFPGLADSAVLLLPLLLSPPPPGFWCMVS